MSDDEQPGRQKRTIKKTEAIRDWDTAMINTKNLRETNARNKKIREERAAIDAAEGKAPEVPTKSKGKAKSKKVILSDDEMEVDSPPEDSILLELQKEEAAMKRLVTLIHTRDFIPIKTLEFWTHKDLEEAWLGGEGAAPKAPAGVSKAGTSKAGASKASGAKAAKPKPKPKAVAKTPAKRIAPVVEPCSVTMLGSPMDALASAKKQSAFAAEDSPIIQRKRGVSTSNVNPGAKRSRLDALDKIKPSKGAYNTGGRSVSGPASTAHKDDLIAMPRSTSQAPTASRGPSQAPAASAPVATSGPALDDPDVLMLGDSDLGEDEEDAQPKKTAKIKKKRAPQGEAKGRATRKNYTGKELEVVDEAFILVRARLGCNNAVPVSHEFNRVVRMCWNEAAEAVGTTAEEFPCDSDHIQLLRDRIGSYRGHAKTRIQNSAGIVYELDTMEGTALKERVKYLLSKHFYVGARQEKRSGFYEHLFVARAIRAMYFVGHRPPALVLPGDYNPMTFNAIAAALAVTHFAIDQYSSGEFQEEKLTFETFSEHYETHLGNLQTWAGCTPAKDVAIVCKNLYEAALSNSGKGKSTRSTNNPHHLTAADFQIDSDDDEEPAPVPAPAPVLHKSKPKPKPSSIQSSSEQATPSNKATSSSERAKSSSKSTSSAKPKSKLVGVVLKLPAKPPSPLKSPEPAPRSSGQSKGLASKPSSGSESESEGSEGSESESESSPVPKAGEKSPARKVVQSSSTPKASLTSKAAAAATGGASALKKSAEPNESSELSGEEEDVEAPKSGGNERKVDEEMEVDEETEAGTLNKGAGDTARGGETIEPPTDRNTKRSSRSSVGAADAPTKDSPAPKSSSALADATGPIAKEKEVVVEEQPKAKEKKGRKGRKKGEKGKEKDPAESGSSGVKTRSALKSAS
ncbi:hypothetical protein FRC09_016919 [Ceratobasidium sp. 395]|nr:hypothetical protein FRC09_016919 [Ceratobasidium sp. 395]